MMQVTGNNILPSRNLSILFSKGGLCFYLYDGIAVKQSNTICYESNNFAKQSSEAIRVICDGDMHFDSVTAVTPTQNYVTIPEQYFDSNNIHQYIKAKGGFIGVNDAIITSRFNGIVYIYIVKDEVVSHLNSLFGKVSYVHPLLISNMVLRAEKESSNLIFLDKIGDNLSISVKRDNQLYFHESVEVYSDSDMVFYLKSVAKRFFKNISLAILTGGFESDAVTELLARLGVKTNTIPLTQYLRQIVK